MNTIRSFAIALVAALGVSSAAAGVITPSSSWGGKTSHVVGGFEFSASATSTPVRTPSLTWTSKEGVQGIGISGGRTGDEIDTDEIFRARSLGGLFVLGSIRLGLLYDGPEFHDVQEIAQISAILSGNVIESFRLTAIRSPLGNVAQWSGPNGSVTNIEPAIQGGKPGGAVWELVNPFGGLLMDGFALTAIENMEYVACNAKRCTNQSDFIFMGATTVPTPGALALMSAGLIGIAALRRRASGR